MLTLLPLDDWSSFLLCGMNFYLSKFDSFYPDAGASFFAHTNQTFLFNHQWLHSRTMQTAVGTFGGDEFTDGINVPPLMVANAGGSNHPAISSLNCPPFLAVELCRERMVYISTSLLQETF